MALENFVLLAHLVSTFLKFSQFNVKSLQGARQLLLLLFELVNLPFEIKDDGVELSSALLCFLESGLSLSNIGIELLNLLLLGFYFVFYLEHVVIDPVECFLLFCG